MGISLVLLLFDRALETRTRENYPQPTSAALVTNDKALPHMVRNYVEWWMDLLAFVAGGLGVFASAALADGRQRLVLSVVAITLLISATLAAVRYSPFEYRSKFRPLGWLGRTVVKPLSRVSALQAKPRALRWTIETLIKKRQPVASPAFGLLFVANIIALLQTIVI